jgi:hypothetical protein
MMSPVCDKRMRRRARSCLHTMTTGPSRTSGLDAGPIYAYTTKLLETRALGPRLRKGGVEPKECSRE